MALDTIRSLARELFEQLVKERTLDSATGFELGRLSTVISMLSGTAPRDPSLRTRSTDREVVHNVQPPSQRIAAPAASVRDAKGHFKPRTGGKRVRPEKRPMRKAQRILTGPSGHVVVYDFEHLQIKDSPPKGHPTVETVVSRKELWNRLKKQKREFKSGGK